MSQQLDDVQDDLYARVALSGDKAVEADALRPAHLVPVDTSASGYIDGREAPSLSLSGRGWKMRGAEPLTSTVSMNEWPSSWMQQPNGAQPQWWRTDSDRSDWLDVTVPTTVQHALWTAGIVPDPMWNDNTYTEITTYGSPPDWPWPFRRTRIEEQEWWFARRFTVPTSWEGAELELAFDGMDYSGTVYLNGFSLGHHEGMFGGPVHTITGLVVPGEENELVVRLDRPPMHWYGKPKGCAGYGWHYGHLISVGLWRDVVVRAVPAVDLRNVYVRTQELTVGSSARLRIHADVDNSTVVEQEVRLHGVIELPRESGRLPFVAETVVPPGPGRIAVELEIGDPHVWWPMGYGDQPLHDLTVQLSPVDPAADRIGPTVRTRFGIRTVEMRGLGEYTGPEHYRWQFVVNGLPMFIKGANWCWTDPLLQGEVEKYEHILELVRRANIQMLRVWGAGNIEDDYFYDSCDRLGILVYQEFPLAWGPPDSPHADLAVIDQQVQAVVQRLRNHPSLVMWGGGNENKDPVGADEALFLIGRRCRQLDPSRPYHRTGPWGGSQHNYLVYHGGQPIDEGYQSTNTVFLGEFGCPSLPRRASVSTYLPRQTLATWPPAPDDGGVLMHQPQFGLHDFVKQLRYADYGPVRSWDDMIEYSQLAQGDALRYAAEMMRAQTTDRTAGFWFYKMTDLFPGNSWAVVDYYGVPKSSYYRAKQVCRPVSAYLRYRSLTVSSTEDFRGTVWVANDTPTERPGLELVCTVYDQKLERLSHRRLPVDLAAGERRAAAVSEVPAAKHQGGLLLVSTRLSDREGTLISDQWYWINHKVKPEPIRAIEAVEVGDQVEVDAVPTIRAYAETKPAPLRDLPGTVLQWRWTMSGADTGVVTVHNTGAVPAFNVEIRGLDDSRGTYLEDNNFCLHPDEERQIGFAGGPPIGDVGVTAWNASEESAVDGARRRCGEGSR